MKEIFTRMNARTANYNGTGGIPSISPEDVAACLAKIKERGPSLLIRAQLMDDVAYRELRALFRQHVAHLAMIKHWKTGPKFAEYFDGLCDSVLHYYLVPDTCGRCHGHGHITRSDSAIIPCPVCAETGHREVSERDKAKTAGIPISLWKDVWEERYTAARDILVAWETEADRVIKRLWWEDV